MNVELIKKAYQLGYRHGLKKLAEESGSAGIGSYEANGIGSVLTDKDWDKLKLVRGNSNSYVGQLRRRAVENGASLQSVRGPTVVEFGDFISPITPSEAILGNLPSDVQAFGWLARGQDISQDVVNSARFEQASHSATDFAPKGSVPWRRIRNNLMNAGKQNQRTYLKTNTVPRRSKPNLIGLEDMKFTPKQLETLRKLQDLQVRAPFKQTTKNV